MRMADTVDTENFSPVPLFMSLRALPRGCASPSSRKPRPALLSCNARSGLSLEPQLSEFDRQPHHSRPMLELAAVLLLPRLPSKVIEQRVLVPSEGNDEEVIAFLTA